MRSGFGGAKRKMGESPKSSKQISKEEASLGAFSTLSSNCRYEQRDIKRYS